MKKYYILGLIGITAITASSYMAYKYYPQYKLYQANKELKDKHYVEAANMLTQLCNEGLGDGCYELSTLYVYGKGVEANENKVEELLQKACDLNSSDGCFEYGMKHDKSFSLLFNSEDIPLAKIEEVFKKTSEALVKGCELGNSHACSAMEILHSSRSAKNDSNLKNNYKAKVKEHLANTIERHTQGCENGFVNQCNQLISIFQHDTSKNEIEAKKFETKRNKILEDDCQAGFVKACIELGKKSDDVKTSRKFFEQACAKNDGEGCREASGGIFNQYNLALNERLKFLAKSCDLNYANGCGDLAYILEEENNNYLDSDNRIVMLYTKGCELGDPFSCNMTASYYLYGNIKKINIKKAIQYYKKGCELKEGGSVCKELADQYNKGKYITQDTELALVYYKKACEKDVKHCNYISKMQKAMEDEVNAANLAAQATMDPESIAPAPDAVE
ncbi:MAG: hypothetical protein PHD04_01325 [Candidatus Pacebacteria bacterium]|nr:hypothetical protein [Candidatus Paceibacterota bacterium]